MRGTNLSGAIHRTFGVGFVHHVARLQQFVSSDFENNHLPLRSQHDYSLEEQNNSPKKYVVMYKFTLPATTLDAYTLITYFHHSSQTPEPR